MINRRYIIALILLVFSMEPLFADCTSGCGVGTKMWKGESGIFAHTSANTSNVSNDFSITSGTSGCDANRTVQNEKKQEIYFAANYEVLTEEISQGQGEHLETFAVLMGCQRSVHPEFSSALKENHEFYFDGSHTPEQMIHGTRNLINQNQRLNQSCN